MVAEDVRQYVDQCTPPLKRAEYQTLVRGGAYEGEHVELVREVVLSPHREPTPRGYRVVTTYRRGERVALLGFPDVTIAVDDVVPA